MCYFESSGDLMHDAHMDTLEKARSLALKRLNAREYSSSAMRTYLKRKGVSSEEAETVVARLVEAGLINDERYAGMFVRDQLRCGKGRRLIQNKLREKGVRLTEMDLRKLIEENVGPSELDMAKELLERRYPRHREGRAEAARALRGLLSRGFDYETARRALQWDPESEG
jgi:regulatory protein